MPSLLLLAAAASATLDAGGDTLTLAYGSCLHQRKPAPALRAAAESRPDAFVWLGDNLYNDITTAGAPCEPMECGAYWPMVYGRILTAVAAPAKRLLPTLFANIAVKVVRSHNNGGGMRDAAAGVEDARALAREYEALEAMDEFRRLRELVPRQFATFDDHDFCRNDGGGSCTYANASIAQFLRFWRGGDGAAAARGGRHGVYESYSFGSGARRVQLLMLDLRTWHSDLTYPGEPGAEASDCRSAERLAECEIRCACKQHPDAPFLGEEQWAWLEARLREPAAVRLIGSSLGFSATYNGAEGWALWPAEQRRMVELIRATRAEGVVFLSGDVHYAEVSVLRAPGVYPLYDFVSSGLTQAHGWDFVPANGNRLDGKLLTGTNHFGRVHIDFGGAAPSLTASVIDEQQHERYSVSVALSALTFANADTAAEPRVGASPLASPHDEL